MPVLVGLAWAQSRGRGILAPRGGVLSLLYPSRDTRHTTIHPLSVVVERLHAPPPQVPFSPCSSNQLRLATPLPSLPPLWPASALASSWGSRSGSTHSRWSISAVGYASIITFEPPTGHPISCLITTAQQHITTFLLFIKRDSSSCLGLTGIFFTLPILDEVHHHHLRPRPLFSSLFLLKWPIHRSTYKQLFPRKTQPPRQDTARGQDSTGKIHNQHTPRNAKVALQVSCQPGPHSLFSYPTGS